MYEDHAQPSIQMYHPTPNRSPAAMLPMEATGTPASPKLAMPTGGVMNSEAGVEVVSFSRGMASR